MNSEHSAIAALAQKFAGSSSALDDMGIRAFFRSGLNKLNDLELADFEDAILGADTAVADPPLVSTFENPEGMAEFLDHEWKTFGHERAEVFLRTLSNELACRHRLGRVNPALLRGADFVLATREGVVASVQAKMPRAIGSLAAAVASLVDLRFEEQAEQLFVFRTVVSWPWEHFALVGLLRGVEALPEEDLLSRAKVPLVVGRVAIHRLMADGAVGEEPRGLALTRFGRILADTTEPEFPRDRPIQSFR